MCACARVCVCIYISPGIFLPEQELEHTCAFQISGHCYSCQATGDYSP